SASVKLASSLTHSFVGNVLRRDNYQKIVIRNASDLVGGAGALAATSSQSFLTVSSAMQESSEQLSADTRKAIEELQKDPNVEYAVPNRILKVQSLAAPTDTYYDQQWNLEAMNVADAWTAVTTAATPTKVVTVAVIDTGIVDHPDLAGRVLKNGGAFAGYD